MTNPKSETSENINPSVEAPEAETPKAEAEAETPKAETPKAETPKAEAPKAPKAGTWACPSDVQRRNKADGKVTFQVWTIPGKSGPGAMVRRVEAGSKTRSIQIVRPDQLAKVIKGLGDEFKPDFEKRPAMPLVEALVAAYEPQLTGLSAGAASRAARAVLVDDIEARPLTSKAIKSWAA